MTLAQQWEAQGEIKGEIRGEIKGEIKAKQALAIRLIRSGMPSQQVAHFMDFSAEQLQLLMEKIDLLNSNETE